MPRRSGRGGDQQGEEPLNPCADIKVSYNASTMCKENLKRGLSPKYLVKVMKWYNEYIKKEGVSFEDQRLIFPEVLIDWCTRVDDENGEHVLVVTQNIKTRATTGGVTIVQTWITLSIAKLLDECALFEHRLFYIGDIKPEDVNKGIFPYNVQSAVGFDPAIAVSALVLKKIVELKESGEDHEPLMLEFVRGFNFVRGERACNLQRNTWAIYAMNSSVGGKYKDPETDEETTVKVNMIMPLSKHNARIENLLLQSADYALATDLVTQDNFFDRRQKCTEVLGVLEVKASKKRTREGSGRREQQSVEEELSEEEEEHDVFMHTDGVSFPSPLKVLDEYISTHFAPEQEPGQQTEDIKLREIKLDRDPFRAWLLNLKGKKRYAKILPETIKGVVWFIEAAFNMSNELVKYWKGLPADIKVIWQPEGVQPLTERAKTKLRVILQKILFLAESKAGSSIMFTYACLLNQPELLSGAVESIVSDGACVEKLLDTIMVIDEPTRTKLRRSNSVYEFFYSLGWIFLRELVQKVNEQRKILMRSKMCTFEGSISFWEKDLLKKATVKNSEDNKGIIEKASDLLRDHIQRMSTKWLSVKLQDESFYIRAFYTIPEKALVCELVISLAMFSPWGQVFTALEPDDKKTIMIRKPSADQWLKVVADTIEHIILTNEDLPADIAQLMNFFNEWADDLAVSIVQNFMVSIDVQLLHGFNDEIMEVLDKYPLTAVSEKVHVFNLLGEIGDTAYVNEHLEFIRNNVARGIAFAGVLPVYEKINSNDDSDDQWIVQRINWFEVHERQLRLNPRILHLSPDDLTIPEDDKIFHLATHEPYNPFAPRPAQP